LGFGISAVSVLVTFGINPAIASASIHTSEGFVDIVSAISHWKLGNIEKGIFFKLVIPGAIGAALGAVFLCTLVSLSIGKPFVHFILLIMGTILLFRFLRKKIVKQQIPKKLIPVLGFVAGFVDVSGGGGWGPLCTPIFILGGSEPRKAIGTVEATEPIISFVAVAMFGLLLGFESFMWSMVIAIIIGGCILTPVAALLSKKIPKRLLGILIGVWLIALNLKALLGN